MRIGDFAVEVVPRGKGVGVREIGSGHVLARPGQVYALRLRNFGPLRCVADVSIDGRNVTAGGLVIDAWCTEELERPISSDEDGRFTVVAEGDERVFGPDGGRDNAALGLIDVHFRRELPGGPERPRPLPPTLGVSSWRDLHGSGPGNPFRPRFDELTKYSFGADDALPNDAAIMARNLRRPPQSLRAPAEADDSLDLDGPGLDAPDIERAAGTGLTGHSTQRFQPTQLGALEKEATVIQLRLVIASVEAIDAARSLVEEPAAPARPTARP
jgi:hypothetical protein